MHGVGWLAMPGAPSDAPYLPFEEQCAKIILMHQI
jgi:hypothetical protein